MDVPFACPFLPVADVEPVVGVDVELVMAPAEDPVLVLPDPC